MRNSAPPSAAPVPPIALALALLASPGCDCGPATDACDDTPCTAPDERFCTSNPDGCLSIYRCVSRNGCLVPEEETACSCSDLCGFENGEPICIDKKSPIDSGTIGDPSDAGTDAGVGPRADAGPAGPSLIVTHSDPCDCDPPPCCPTTTFDFLPGDTAALHLMCGDDVACDPPPVGWERMNAAGGWDRVVSPGEDPSAAYLCTPATYVDPWIYSVSTPPSGTVRAVALFIDDCGPDPAMCTPTGCTGTPFEVTSNSFFTW